MPFKFDSSSTTSSFFRNCNLVAILSLPLSKLGSPRHLTSSPNSYFSVINFVLYVASAIFDVPLRSHFLRTSPVLNVNTSTFRPFELVETFSLQSFFCGRQFTFLRYPDATLVSFIFKFIHDKYNKLHFIFSCPIFILISAASLPFCDNRFDAIAKLFSVFFRDLNALL